MSDCSVQRVNGTRNPETTVHTCIHHCGNCTDYILIADLDVHGMMLGPPPPLEWDHSMCFGWKHTTKCDYVKTGGGRGGANTGCTYTYIT